MADKKNTTKNTTNEATDNKARAAARSAAGGRLRENHREEYDAYLLEEMQSRGIDWKPKPTKEDRAKSDLEKILSEYPHLRGEVTGQAETE